MIVFIRILLLLLPLIGVIYFLRWRHRAKVSGEVPNDEDLKNFRTVLITMLASMVLLGVLLRFVDTSSADRNTTYVPPHVVDGKLIPGEFKEKEDEGKSHDSPTSQDQE